MRRRSRLVPSRASGRARALPAVAVLCLLGGCQTSNEGPTPFRTVTGSPTDPALATPSTPRAALTRPTPSATTRTTPTATPLPKLGTTTAWSVDFTGAAGTPPDDRLLTARAGGNGWGNKELETYTPRAANAALDGAGHLAINAVRERYTGTDGITRQWTSARLDSLGKWSFTTGTLAVRMKVPDGAGTWPAFWLEGTDLPTVGWPQAGEIDIVEALGGKNQVFQSLHGPDGRKGGYAHSAELPVPAGLNIGSSYHVFSITRSSGKMVFAVDEKNTATVTRKDLPQGQQWVFDKPMFAILDLAVGGTWPGAPTASTPSPSSLLVDWIRFIP